MWRCSSGLVPRLTKLPWIPTEPEWLALLAAFRGESARNRLMLALAYDAALRREELCLLRTDDLDPGRRTLGVRAETPALTVRCLRFVVRCRVALSVVVVGRVGGTGR